LVDDQILLWPVAEDFYDLTKLLLEKGVSAKSWPKSIGTNFTPIEYAAREGHKNIVDLLLEYGAMLELM
jgi:ankyrin repeat protein